jgi:hypothetical protein
MAKGSTFQNYGAPRSIAFSELLALHSVADAGLLPELSNSFPMVASLDDRSTTLKKVLRRAGEGHELAWHYSLRRSNPCVTRFKAGPAAGEVTVEKELLGAAVPNHGEFHWHAPSQQPVLEGTQLRTALVRRLYFQDWAGFEETLEAFFRWSFSRWSQGGELAGEAIDAIYHNAVIAPQGGYELFDLEWRCSGTVSKSWFISRNLFGLIRELEFLTKSAPYSSLGDLYLRFCAKLEVSPDLESDLLKEARFQHTASGSTGPEIHLQQLRDLFAKPFDAAEFPKVPAWEHRIRRNMPQTGATRMDFAFHKAAGMAATGIRRVMSTAHGFKSLIKRTH